ncbi:YhdH/YhfP family quinone oxidoreductase [Fodinibius sediminis]|uniref:Putative quinone oxidoreductase, YhdH/YhfP family n=1 Tax=Fodinibius sediminis TaxID=1214077 RepID=A0A521AIZ0_9BACT|nr:YhdH/YhfP family quinone oxidoreductase [Fodinibius sediminis]SMO34753.1 putative quinone oxidoreductase, YhdH/YhfP family [Fodinibius sediminis]
MTNTFRALVVEETADDQFHRSVRQWPVDQLPEHAVLVRVHYSSLNYKDALSASGDKGVTRQYPHIPGIDAAGVVQKSRNARFHQGDRVIVTSYDLGQNTPGGFGQFIRVPASWVVPLPEGLTLRESMALGTAGLTAAIGVHHLRQHQVKPDGGDVLVTGATGGVGTMAISILARLGYEVAAATGKTNRASFLKKIGAHSVIQRDEVQDQSGRPLLSSRWAGAIDTVGGRMLDTALRQTQPNGTVSCCGNVAGGELHTSVYPFILRGITLAGIDSGNCPMRLRRQLWEHLATSWKPRHLEEISRECSLDELSTEIDKILEGGQVGRVVVKH